MLRVCVFRARVGSLIEMCSCGCKHSLPNESPVLSDPAPSLVRNSFFTQKTRDNTGFRNPKVAKMKKNKQKLRDCGHWTFRIL